jgi:glycosyltransferase involved in cell wall biosynthesis
MKLSIITINFNNAVGLRKTIESVVNQTFLDLEYIIIDGGSTDGSLEIIKEYKNNITYWISEPDSGIYNAMNKGIVIANGEYLQFLNSGDWLVNDSIIGTIFQETLSCDLLYGNMIMIMPDGKSKINYGTGGSEITFLTFYFSFIIHPASFIRRELFFLYGFYDENLKIVSDWKFYLIAFGLNASKIIYKNIEVNYYDMCGVSFTQTESAMLERQKVLSELIPYPILADFKNIESDLLKLNLIKKFSITNKLYHITQFPITFLAKLLNKMIELSNGFRNR